MRVNGRRPDASAGPPIQWIVVNCSVFAGGDQHREGDAQKCKLWEEK